MHLHDWIMIASLCHPEAFSICQLSYLQRTVFIFSWPPCLTLLPAYLLNYLSSLHHNFSDMPCYLWVRHQGIEIQSGSDSSGSYRLQADWLLGSVDRFTYVRGRASRNNRGVASSSGSGTHYTEVTELPLWLRYTCWSTVFDITFLHFTTPLTPSYSRPCASQFDIHPTNHPSSFLRPPLSESALYDSVKSFSSLVT